MPEPMAPAWCFDYNPFTQWNGYFSRNHIFEETGMLKKLAMAGATAALMLGFCATGALADDCSGKDHSTGTILGGVGGAAIGGVASHGNGLAILGGALLGGLAGNAVSRDLDCQDQARAAASYNDSFSGRVGVRHEWTSDDHDHGYTVTDREYRRNGQLCRDFTQVTYRRGREMDQHGTACKNRRSGNWEFM
jgi:surface antigen